MCGRYALFQRPSEVRQHLSDNGMQVDSWPDDDDPSLRHTYNFAPGNHGLVYRANAPDTGAGPPHDAVTSKNSDATAKDNDASTNTPPNDDTQIKYKLQGMKWGLIPFWTKRAPEYGSMLKTINCRDDSLANTGGMWNTMKQRKRCIVVCAGFYEWYKKPNSGGKVKVPHYIKRADDKMMLFAGLWDCVKYEAPAEAAGEKLYTYSVITTSSNKQLGWLHDRMPVILEPGSEELRMWLDPGRSEWSKELQSLLKPYEGELMCYPVDQAVGKVGNNSPSFIVPVDSKDNKKNIANFFGGGNAKAEPKVVKKKNTDAVAAENPAQDRDQSDMNDGATAKDEPDVKADNTEERIKVEIEGTESNAPLPNLQEQETESPSRSKTAEPDWSADSKGVKREASASPAKESPAKAAKTNASTSTTNGRRLRSATSNNNRPAKSPAKGDGSEKITSFFGK